ncbi:MULTISPECIES: hypothetical protein [unclassified Chryseobacterium]|uniref:hypothetical protein n=1 Tax=unclassified Chryseobacterium TaxID=2593645 RepID=UPI002AFE8D53|nr:hypothetical protein [Chryseobacterium sp. MHB01]
MKIIASIFLGLFVCIVATVMIFYIFFSKRLQLPSYDLTLLLALTQFVILLATLIFSISFFRSYKNVLTTINDEDLETLRKISESRFWLNRYLPSFIIYSGKIKVFKWFSQPEFYFSELKEIKIKTMFTRGSQNKLVIFKKLKGGSFFFAIDNNQIQQKHLFDKAIEYNPNILIGDSSH